MLTITFGNPGGFSRSISLLDTQSAESQTLAIQTALDAVAERPGGFVRLSAGTFTLSSDGLLQLGAGTHLKGAGVSLTILKLPAGANPFQRRVSSGSNKATRTRETAKLGRIQIEDVTIEVVEPQARVGDVLRQTAERITDAECSIAFRGVKIYDVSRRTLDFPVCPGLKNSTEGLALGRYPDEPILRRVSA